MGKNRWIMGSALGIAALAVAIDHTRHRLPEAKPASERSPVEQQYYDYGELESGPGQSGTQGSAAPCGLDGAPCGLGQNPCGVDGNPCSL